MVLIGFDLSLDLIAKNMKEIYRQDSLTGLLNRNAYDSDVEQLRSADIGAVVCVYADMIGLHLRGDGLVDTIAKVFQAGDTAVDAENMNVFKVF